MRSRGTVASGGSRLIIASILRPDGRTGVHTHVRQLCRFLCREGASATVVTPFSWGRWLSVPVFGVRLPLERLGRPARAASVLWYYHWHEAFLRRALRRRLVRSDECVVYAQGPRAARAALRARHGSHQRVVMAVHFHTSQADEWVDKGMVRPGGRVFTAIRGFERDVIPKMDGIVYVSEAARDALLKWLPEAAVVRGEIIPNFVDALVTTPRGQPLGDLVTVGGLERAKNHTYLLEVLAAAKGMGRRYTLDVFGSGPMRRSLLRSARTLGVDGQVRLHGFRPNVRQHLPGYRAYVHASLRESQSLALIEAQASGLPLVAGDVGGIRSVCDECCEARFWPLDDARRAATILIELLEDGAALASAAAASRARFHLAFAANTVAPRLLTFILDEVSAVPQELCPEAPVDLAHSGRTHHPMAP